MNGLSLGIPGAGVVNPGTHFCALYSGPAERDRLLYPFIEEGLRQGDKCMCLIDDVEPALVRDRAVGQPGPDYSRRSAQLDVERSSDAYLRSGEFSVEDMVSFLSDCVASAIADDFDLFRAAGEMSWVLSGAPGWDDLFIYESSLNQVVEDVPVVLMCLYDLKEFGAEMLVEVLHTHPKVLLDGTVSDNPHYVPPARYPLAAKAVAEPRYPLTKGVAHEADATDHGWASLTDAELRVIARVAQGVSNRRVAEELCVSPPYRRRPPQAHLPQARRPLSGRDDRAGAAAPPPRRLEANPHLEKLLEKPPREAPSRSPRSRDAGDPAREKHGHDTSFRRMEWSWAEQSASTSGRRTR